MPAKIRLLFIFCNKGAFYYDFLMKNRINSDIVKNKHYFCAVNF